MKTVLFFLGIILSIPSFAQLKPGFSKEEARDMLAICNSFTFLDLYNSDLEIIPRAYKKKYTSGVFGMDNKYQIYQNGRVAVINFRGSTDKEASWLENIYSAMIPAKGVMEIAGEKIDYCFANDEAAAVHSGYALGIACLSKDIIDRVNNLNLQGVYEFIITGHSQGGALANMLRAYLENLSHNEISKKNKFKTYTFAAPMVGNKVFANDYNASYASDQSSFNIINPEDPIPGLPFSYNDTNYIADNIKSLLFDRESFSWKKMITDGSAILFRGNLSQLFQRVGASASKRIVKDVGTVEMPAYVSDINYQWVNNRVELASFEYPKILKDSSILQNDSLMTLYEKDKEGNFYNDKLYEKGSWGFQHKPYNYYVGLLKMYFPADYKLLKRKYLVENL
ncbi:MAG: hypothetical protein ABI855_01975 [Bacteroidota bacterium]